MKRKRVIGAIVLIFLGGWLIQAQRIMKFRESDDHAKKEFDSLGIKLKTSYFLAGIVKLHYVQVGSDTLPTLFFVHGSPGSWDAFKHFLQDKDLRTRFRIISVDRPGFGYSDFNCVKHLDEQAVDIDTLLLSIGNGKPLYLIGHSLGGPLVVDIAIKNPGMVSGLIILAGSLDPSAEKPEKWRPVLFKTPLNYFVPGALRPSNRELWFLKSDLKELAKHLAKLTCAVWIIHGDKDNMVPVSNVDYDKKMFVNVKDLHVQILPGANHFIPWEHFNEIRQTLLGLP